MKKQNQQTQSDQVIRVGKSYYKTGYLNDNGQSVEKIIPWSKSAILAEPGGKEYIETIPKFDAFCNIPDNSEKYSRVFETVNSKLYNLYQPVNHKPKTGCFPAIFNFLENIFETNFNLRGESLYNFILDYLTILYTNPTKKLPSLCLVSAERATGKSTFLKFLQLLFKENATIIDNEMFTSKYTSRFVSKLIIGIDESFIPVDDRIMRERLKNFITGRQVWLEAQGREAQELNFYGKLILCSNDEKNFNNLKSDFDGFSIIKLSKPKYDDSDLLRKMEAEIPAFVAFLISRNLYYDVPLSRYWFDTETYTTKNGINKGKTIITFNEFIPQTDAILIEKRIRYITKTRELIEITATPEGKKVIGIDEGFIPNDHEEMKRRIKAMHTSDPDKGKSISTPAKIITLCGSTKFIDEFEYQNARLTFGGNIVLTIGIDTKKYKPLINILDIKSALDKLHLIKIKISDEIFVINKGGYIGESTAKEIEFAKSLDKVIKYLEPRNYED